MPLEFDLQSDQTKWKVAGRFHFVSKEHVAPFGWISMLYDNWISSALSACVENIQNAGLILRKKK